MPTILQGLGIQFQKYTKPQYIKQLFELTGLSILLRVPENPQANKAVELLRKITSSPITFEPIAEGMINGFEKNPLTQAGILSTISDNTAPLFDDDRNHIAHYSLILEIIVQLMLKDVFFLAHVMDSFAKKTKAISHYRNSIFTVLMGSMRLMDPFVGIKIASIEPALWVDRFVRENQSDPTHFSNHHGLALANRCDRSTYSHHRLSTRGLSLNIAEATAWDESQINKLLGTALISGLQGDDPIEKKYAPPTRLTAPSLNIEREGDFWHALYSHAQQDNTVMHLPKMNERWNDLYIIWNLIFVLRNYPQFGAFFFSKLCIPSVLNAKTDFLIARTYAIWITFFVVENALSYVSFFSVMKSNKAKTLDLCGKEITPTVVRSSLFSEAALSTASQKFKRCDMMAARAMYSIIKGRPCVEEPAKSAGPGPKAR